MSTASDWGWTDVGLLLAVSVILACLSLGGYARFQDHSIQFYYISDHGNNTSHNGYCIDGYREWWGNDSGVFCSDDIQKTVTVLKEMNDGLRETKKPGTR